MTLRVALLTLESAASAEAAAKVLRETSQQVVFLGVSDPFRGGLARTREMLRRSGPRILPWLFVEFAAPRLGRRRVAGPLAAAARARGLPAFVVDDINGPRARAALEAAQPDLIVTCHFDQILQPEVIALAARGGINLHPSMLPLHRGPMPCFWAAAEGNGEFGVSVHRLVERVDAGAVVAQRSVAPPEGATVSSIARALHLIGAEMLLEVIEDIAADRDHGREVAPLPYRPFPDRAALAEAAGRGVRLSGWADLRAARALGGVAA